MERTLNRVSLVFLAVLLAGCMETPVATVLRTVDPSAPPAEGLGAIAGRVVDAEQMPLVGVSVGLAGMADSTVQTDDAGAYRLDDLEPGAYLVYYQRPGYSSLARRLEVVLDNVTSADVTLEAVPILFPYHKTEHFDGYMALDLATPTSTWRVGRNADPNDRTSFTTPIKEGLSSVVVGLSWTASGPGSAQRMGVSLFFEELFTHRFEGGDPVSGRADNWPNKDAGNLTQTVSLPLGKLQNPAEAVTVSYQQRFDLYTVLYYHDRAPVDASALPE